MRAAVYVVALFCLAAGLSGCFNKRSVVVERSHSASVSRHARDHVVKRGDTLYGIAFSHGLDFREVARWNGIRPPYTIYPGQRLRLTASASRRVAAAPPKPRSPAPPLASASSPKPRASNPAVPASPPSRGNGKPPIASASSSTSKPPLAASTPSSPAPSANGNSKPSGTGSVTWRWPATGELLSRFVAGDPIRQGIDIGGQAGDPVLAASTGEVVYSGTGLVGYGELIIVKHSDTWLSAYGHNRKRLVAEGARVKAGQPIAELGRSGASREQLHFEIRRNGKPVDPLTLLPKR